MVTKIQNKELIKDVYRYDVVLLLMDIYNSMSSGFLKNVAVNFPDVRTIEAKNGYGDKRKRGTIFQIDSNDGVTFCVCYCSNNLLDSCLEKVALKYNGCNIASILYNKDDIEIYEYYFGNSNNTNVTLYDDDDDFNLKYFHKYQTLRNSYKQKEINKAEYIRQKDLLEWERTNGIYKKMPDGWSSKKNKRIFVI